MFHSNGSLTRHPLPSTGSPFGLRFPCFTGNMECSDFLPSLPPHFVAFAWRYHACAAAFVSPFGRQRKPEGQGLLGPVSPIRLVLDVGTAGSPRFLEDPHVNMPWSWTPVGSPRQAEYNEAMLPSVHPDDVGSHECGFSGLSRMACPLAVYASQHGSPRDHARLASGCRPALPGGIGCPLGPNVRFSATTAMVASLLTSSPKLSWRNGISHMTLAHDHREPL
jgi:hypothetical protein